MRINDDKQLNKLVVSIVGVLPRKTEEAVKQFLDVRLTPYNKDKRIDAHLKLKAGTTYLPYPYNVKLVGRLYDCVTSSSEQDEYDI